jgi:outer membrane protein
MLRNSIYLVLLTCAVGCYPNRAVIDPYSYAPFSPSEPWSPPSTLKPMVLSDDPPDLPSQDDPYSLGELIDIALRNNQQTKITWAQARSAAANYGQSQSQFFPSVNGSFSYARYREPTFITTGAMTSATPGGTNSPSTLSAVDIYYTYWNPELNLSYLIYDFGTLRATSEAARQALYNADWTHNDAILSLLQTIMTDFYTYLYQKQLLIADAADVETAQLTLEAAQTGFDTGVRDVSDVLQAKTQLLQNQTTWAGQQQNVETAYTQMLNDMGLPANMKLATQTLPTTLPDKEVIPPAETLIAVALQNRPDLLAAEANLRSKQQSLLAAKRQFLPQFNYTFNLGKDYYNDGVHDVYNFVSTFSVSMPLFQGFFYRNAIKIAEANKAAAEDQVKQSELSMIQEITSYHFNVNIAYETLQFATAFLAAAEEQYVVALAQYKQGTNTILDVVSAQSSLANARASQANALQQWFTSLANLAYATGMLSPNYLNPFSQGEEVKIADVNNNEVSNNEESP